MPETKLQLNINVPIPDAEQLVRDLLITAVEGGINNWCDNVDILPAENPGLEHLPCDGSHTLIFRDAEERTLHRLGWSQERIQEGLNVMAGLKLPDHAANLVSGDWDAETADVFIQCCLFGEVKFG